ncbi:MAG TPA: hypothetical protein VGR64_01240 [Terracidiphilus sp.]|nr:hypothetical protein [Terracidiphilus sp.]
MPRLLERINFSKLVVILASTFGIALGACGLTALVSGSMGGDGKLLFTLGFAELAVMILSAAGLVLTVIVWIVVSMIGDRGGDGDESTRIFKDPSDGDKHP